MTENKLRLHKDDRFNDILNRLVELANDETSGFSEDDKKRFIEKLAGYEKKDKE